MARTKAGSRFVTGRSAEEQRLLARPTAVYASGLPSLGSTTGASGDESSQDCFSVQESEICYRPTTIIGETGRYQIHKVVVPAPFSKPRNGRVQLGISITTREWMEIELRKAFPGFTSCLSIKSVRPHSLAAQAGVMPKDVVCCSSGPEPVAFHVLLGGSSVTSWKLMKEAQFEKQLDRLNNSLEDDFCFYVARKKVDKETSSSSAHSIKGITLSDQVAAKLRDFNLLSSEGKSCILQEVREDARKQFEEDRDSVIASLPAVFRNSFFEIAFAKWGTKYQPVLILNPYSIPPGDVRNLWLRKYDVRKEKGTLEKVNFLVYWYGEIDHPTERYAIISQDKTLSWQEGKARGFAEVPKSILRKRKLSHIEATRVRGQAELVEDFKKHPAERAARIPAFKELYELISEQDLVELAQEDFGAATPRSTAVGRKPGNSKSPGLPSVKRPATGSKLPVVSPGKATAATMSRGAPAAGAGTPPMQQHHMHGPATVQQPPPPPRTCVAAGTLPMQQIHMQGSSTMQQSPPPRAGVAAGILPMQQIQMQGPSRMQQPPPPPRAGVAAGTFLPMQQTMQQPPPTPTAGVEAGAVPMQQNHMQGPATIQQPSPPRAGVAAGSLPMRQGPATMQQSPPPPRTDVAAGTLPMRQGPSTMQQPPPPPGAGGPTDGLRRPPPNNNDGPQQRNGPRRGPPPDGEIAVGTHRVRAVSAFRSLAVEEGNQRTEVTAPGNADVVETSKRKKSPVSLSAQSKRARPVHGGSGNGSAPVPARGAGVAGAAKQVVGMNPFETYYAKVEKVRLENEKFRTLHRKLVAENDPLKAQFESVVKQITDLVDAEEGGPPPAINAPVGAEAPCEFGEISPPTNVEDDSYLADFQMYLEDLQVQSEKLKTEHNRLRAEISNWTGKHSKLRQLMQPAVSMVRKIQSKLHAEN